MRRFPRLPALTVLLAACALASGCASSRPADTRTPLQMAADYSAQKSGTALLVWQDGAWVLEADQDDAPADATTTRHAITDGSVLLWGLVALAMIDDGALTLNAPVAETVSEWADDPQKRTITVADLLHGTSGLETAVRQFHPTDDALAQPLVHEPGDAFRYGSTAFQVFSEVVNRTVGGRYLKTRILRPIGIKGGYWSHTDKTIHAADGSHLTPREWARIGRLILQDGRWNGERVLPNLDRLTEPAEASPGFGLGVWLNTAVALDDPFFDHLPAHFDAFPLVLTPDGPSGWIYEEAPNDLFMAAGGGGQRLYVLPSQDLVVVRVGRADASWNDAEFLARLLDGRAYVATEGDG